ncbi:MAG: hypothetical protein A3A04_01900 [Candidatus Harrisonbacteria bacterium RIFCSPLOWO2_01_FULL_40_28]|uniref:Uncharacterized protein n=2 Tax=Candidatus Harrisoniibacteriota TaxID=1817905 RepID=A0A1G1ZWR3_9BACT|nr:MAG: hypothetical protein A3A04_01900 [Candidatus Harrisonbacteria bacterium RIFCSPLOWO2_01_FULL_40_28]OGY69088.1 MAG: hypothetical protein A2586_01115 [Candidatus Harrisonbacteria bacterium RIFOXYD1_FULL_40_9]
MSPFTAFFTSDAFTAITSITLFILIVCGIIITFYIIAILRSFAHIMRELKEEMQRAKYTMRYIINSIKDDGFWFIRTYKTLARFYRKSKDKILKDDYEQL